MRTVKERRELAIERVKAVRERANLTQEQFAEKIEVATNTISRIERGENDLTAIVALKINQKFFISLDYLFGLTPFEEGEPPCSATCEELLNAQNLVEIQTTEIERLRGTINIIKNVLDGKERPIITTKKSDCSD